MARRFVAVLSACGLAASIFIYLRSLNGVTEETMSRCMAALLVGAILFQVVLATVERSWGRRYSWKDLHKGRPRWVALSTGMVWLIGLAYFVWFMVKSHAASPTIQNDHYVLESHGRIQEVISEAEYLALKADELRLYAWLLVTLYYDSMLRWWFPRKNNGGVDDQVKQRTAGEPD